MSVSSMLKSLIPAPIKVDTEYVVSRVSHSADSPDCNTLTLEVTAHPDVIAQVRAKVVADAYAILGQAAQYKGQ